LLFDRTLSGLLDGDAELKLSAATDPSVREQLAVVQNLWTGFQKTMHAAESITEDQITLAFLMTLNTRSLEILTEMNKAVKLFELQARKTK